MKARVKAGVLALLGAVALSLSACGNSGSGGAGQDETTARETTTAVEATTETTGGTTSGMEGMDGSSGGMASGMLMENGRYSDERFIDTMVAHHRGAVQMARVALKNAEHQEIKNLARNIVVAQEREIEELKRIKQKEFGTSEVPMQMNDGQMMGMTDPQMLADQRPFDKAFIDAMIPHHRSAIEMAQIAFKESENPRIRALAADIVDAQTREIRQMKHWRQEWYPEG